MEEHNRKAPSILESLLNNKDSIPEDPLGVLTPAPEIKPDIFEELPGEIKQFSSDEGLRYKIKHEIFKEELPHNRLTEKNYLSDDPLALSMPISIIKKEVFEDSAGLIKQEFSEDGLLDKIEHQETFKEVLPDPQLPEEIHFLDTAVHRRHIVFIKQEIFEELRDETEQEIFKEEFQDDHLQKECMSSDASTLEDLAGEKQIIGECRSDILETRELMFTSQLLGQEKLSAENCDGNIVHESTSLSNLELTNVDKKYKCDECNKMFSKRGNLVQHKLFHSGVKNHICDVCSKAFTRANDLTRHKLIHSPDNLYKCEICNKTFSQAGYLSSHKLSHSNIKRYQCDQCDKAFKYRVSFNRHKFKRHGGVRYQCNECQKSYAVKKDLSRHILTHTAVKKYVCGVCNKAFLTSSGLSNHVLIHSGIKKYKCDVCMMTFAQASNLCTHKKIHSDIKKYKCDICNKTFRRVGDLLRHKLIHSNVKEYKCETCNKTFRRIDELSQHKLTHTDIIRFTVYKV